MGRADRGLVFVPYIYTGGGSSYTPVAIARHFAPAGHEALAFMPSLRATPPADLPYRTFVPAWLPRPLRSGRFHRAAYAAVARRLVREVRRRPSPCPVWVWPNAHLDTIRALKDAGAYVILEMINTHQATARAILEAEAERSGLRGPVTITDEAIAGENAALALVDRIVSPSEGVDRSLAEQGIASNRIYRSFFGWDPARFPPSPTRCAPSADGLNALFVGDITVRKGAHLALAAWLAADIAGEFILAGRVLPEMEAPLAAAISTGRVRHVPFTPHLERLYRAADVLLFPTLEEGAPLVCYEAAGCGLPIITGPMGTARLVEDNRSGFVIDPHDEAGLIGALRRLAQSPELREAMALEIGAKAQSRRWADAAQDRINWLRTDPRFARMSEGQICSAIA